MLFFNRAKIINIFTQLGKTFVLYIPIPKIEKLPEKERVSLFCLGRYPVLRKGSTSNRMETSLSRALTVAKSCFPSPLKSPVAIENGTSPTETSVAALYVAAQFGV